MRLLSLIKRFIMWLVQGCCNKTLFYVPNRNKIAMSIDDSPSQNTAAILDLLDEFHVHATFFIIGEHAQRYPNVLHEIINRGHEIGNHSIVDEASFKNSPNEFRQHIQQTKEIIDSFTAEPTKYFRPGSGISCSWMNPILIDLGYEFNIDGNAFCCISTSAHAFDVNVPRAWVNSFCPWLLTSTIKGGDIIDIHDRDFTLTELRKTIEKLIHEGYEIGTITELINEHEQVGQVDNNVDNEPQIINIDNSDEEQQQEQQPEQEQEQQPEQEQEQQPEQEQPEQEQPEQEQPEQEQQK